MTASRRPRWRVAPSPSSAHPDDRPVTVTPVGPASEGPADELVTAGHPDRDGRIPVEVVTDGWRFELLVEDADRAELRERATRDRGAAGAGGGRSEIRAIIPGRVASVAVVPGDAVDQGDTLLTVEAMKMQNELRAPRAGTVASVPAVAGATIELGDLLVVLE